MLLNNSVFLSHNARMSAKTYFRVIRVIRDSDNTHAKHFTYPFPLPTLHPTSLPPLLSSTLPSLFHSLTLLPSFSSFTLPPFLPFPSYPGPILIILVPLPSFHSSILPLFRPSNFNLTSAFYICYNKIKVIK